MVTASRTMTRRQLLRSAGLGAAGLTLAGAVGEVVSGALASHGPVAPTTPHWHSRPDLRIPSLTVARSEAGVSTDPIFIAPYNAPNAPGGGGDRRQRRSADLGEPAGGDGDHQFQGAELSRQSGADVVGGQHRTRPRGRRVRDRRRELPHDPPGSGGARAARRPARVRDHPQDTALLTSYVVTEADLSASAARGTARSRTRSSRRSISPPARFCSSGTASITSRWRSPTRRRARIGTSFTSTRSSDLGGDGDLLISGRSTHTIYKIDRSGAIVWRLGGKHSDFEHGLRQRLRLAARCPPAARRDAHDLRQRSHPRGRAALARPDPRRRRAGDDGHAAASVHPPEGARRQPGQRAAAAERQRLRRLGGSAHGSRSSTTRVGCSSTRSSARSTSPTGRSACPGRASRPKLPQSLWPATAAS